MRSLKSQYDPEEGSNMSDDPILTPEPSKAGGSYGSESDNCAASSDQRGKSDHHDSTPKSSASDRPHDKIKKSVEVASHSGSSHGIFVLVAVLALIFQLLLLFLRFRLTCPTSSEANLSPPPLEFELEKHNEIKPWNESNPWPGNTYMIIEKKSGCAITLQNGELFLPALDREGQEAAQTADNTWLCCEQNNYWGFQNTATGRYIGHDGGDGMRVTANSIQNWEMMVARPLPGGGYQLLMPHYWHTLQVVAIGDDGRRLTRRMHGGAVWGFRMVQT